METTILRKEKDPMGAAIYDYFQAGKAGKLRVFSSQFEEDEIPVKELFRTYAHMPVLEQTALNLAEGKILDVVRWPCRKWERRQWPSTFRRFRWR